MLFSTTKHYLSEVETKILTEFLYREFGLTNIASITAKPNQLTEVETIETYRDKHSAERFKKFADEYNKQHQN